MRLLPLFLLALTLSAPAARSQNAAGPMPVPDPPQVPVQNYILVDVHSGRLLAEHRADDPVEPASLTKLMTAYVVYQGLRDGTIGEDDVVTISEKAWRTPGSRMFVEVGSKVPLRDLILGMVVQSGNDASVALAEHVAGSEETFTTLMNQQAARLGLTQTHFVNATGLPDPEHLTSARDVAILSRAIIREFPEHYARYAQRSYTYNSITQHNRNRLLWQDESVDGIKTGHTESAGYCLAASARRGNMRLVSVVLGAEREAQRFNASKALLSYGFRFFETHRLYEAGASLIETRIYKGESEQIPLGIDRDLYVTIPAGRYQEMSASMQISREIEAPAVRGTQYGLVTVSLDGNTVAETPLVALQDIPEGGLMRRLYDEGVLLFESFLE